MAITPKELQTLYKEYKKLDSELNEAMDNGTDTDKQYTIVFNASERVVAGIVTLTGAEPKHARAMLYNPKFELLNSYTIID